MSTYHHRYNEPQDQDVEALYTITEVARRVRVDPSTVRRYIRRGLVRSIPLPHTGNRITHRIPQSSLDAMLAASLEPPSPLR